MTKLTFTETQKLINKYDIGYIYIVRVGEYIKIGISNMPEQRIALIRSDNPKSLEEILTVKIPLKYDTEQNIHKQLKVVEVLHDPVNLLRLCYMKSKLRPQ
jgi:hypothetical protein